MTVLSNQNLGKAQGRGSSVKKKLGGTIGERRVYSSNYRTGKKMLIRHNLDVMHIEKNIGEIILGTLLGIDGNCKDGEKAWLDL